MAQYLLFQVFRCNTGRNKRGPNTLLKHQVCILNNSWWIKKRKKQTNKQVRDTATKLQDQYLKFFLKKIDVRQLDADLSAYPTFWGCYIQYIHAIVLFHYASMLNSCQVCGILLKTNTLWCKWDRFLLFAEEKEILRDKEPCYVIDFIIKLTLKKCNTSQNFKCFFF